MSGAGKGTQAERLQEDFDLAYIATGDLLRHHVEQETELGREASSYMDAGKLVPVAPTLRSCSRAMRKTGDSSKSASGG